MLLDAPRDQALARLDPAYLPPVCSDASRPRRGSAASYSSASTSASYRTDLAGRSSAASLELRRGEIVALTGATAWARRRSRRSSRGSSSPRQAPSSGTAASCYLSQDPGRYLVTERAEDEAPWRSAATSSAHARRSPSVGLAGLERRHPRDLSSGERERLALASVLVADPDVLILDEPTRGVDPPRKSELAEILRGEAANRATLVVTHDLVFAGEVADRVVQLERRELARA